MTWVNSHTATCSFSTPAEWGENRRKAKKLLDRDNGSLIGKVKVVCTTITRGGVHPLLPIAGHTSIHLMRSRASACIISAQEENYHNYGCLCSFPLPLYVLLLLSSLRYTLNSFILLCFLPSAPGLLTQGNPSNGLGFSQERRNPCCFFELVSYMHYEIFVFP